MRLLSAGAVAAVVSGCGATSDVRQAVEAERAAPAGVSALAAGAPSTALAAGGPAFSDAAAPAAGSPAAGGTVATDTGTATTTSNQSAKVGTGAAKPAAGAPGAAACGAAAPAGGNGGATDTGVSATSIKIGGTFFNGGFLDKYGQAAESSARAYFDYVNDSGGICGRKVEYIPCDTAGTANGTTGCLTKLADQDKVFAMGPSLDFNLDIVQTTLDQRKLPWVGSSGLYDAEFTSPWMFPTQIPGSAVGALITTHTIRELGLKKIGVSFLRNGAGPSCTEQTKKTAAALGGQVVQTSGNGDVETSLDSQVAALKNAGAEAVLFCNDPVNTVKYIQAAQRVGWHPLFFGGFVAAADVPQAAGTYGKGMYGLTMYDFYGANTPGVQQYRKITEFYFPNTFHHFYEQVTYVGAAAIVAALRATGPDVTRAAFLTQLKKMRSFDVGLGLKLDFANLRGATPSGVIIKADDSLQWQVASKRFTPAGSAGSAVSGVAAPSMAATLDNRQRATAAGRRALI
ncbi:MAG TPA: ABC transporter substrate-binding protein [Sporichthya sp.]|nr:ABC transporter substrate-binding protein [Sporichthya sp.]